MSEEQKEYLSKSYDWIVNVLQTQKRMLPINELYTAYPFKKKGLTKEGLQILSNTITEAIK